MTLDEYQVAAANTAVYPMYMGLQYTALGLAGETGEYCDKIKKVFRDAHGKLDEETTEALHRELGDVLWYVAMCAMELGSSLGDIAKTNIEKLEARKQTSTLHGSGDNR